MRGPDQADRGRNRCQPRVRLSKSTSLLGGVYEAMFAQGIDGFLLSSPEGRLLRANARACDLLGWPEAELWSLGAGTSPTGGSRPARLAVTASVGLSSSAGPAELDTLLREADAAVRRAKENGRNRVAWFDAQLHEGSVQRMETQRDLRLALGRDELFLEYQPAFDLRYERITHLEALVRWRHPVRGVVPSADFIPVAEESGPIIPLGEWVLARVIEQAARWAHVPGLRVWFNVAPQQLVDRRMPELLAGHLARVGVAADRLGIEVPESTFDGCSSLAEVLEEVRALGVAVAIDDFGTGYSSLARLGELPADVIKTDRSFVHDLGTSRGEAVLASIVTLAHA